MVPTEDEGSARAAGAVEDPERAGSLFREEALRHHAGPEDEGSVLRLSPAWASWTYWLLLGVVACGLVFVCVAKVREYARGPAVLRLEGRTLVTAPKSGAIAAILVEPGLRVAAGEELVRFEAAQERADLDRTRREFEAQLVERLTNPEDEASGHALTTLRAELARAESRLDERSLRAPHDGFVSDIRVRQGQFLNEGEIALSLHPADARFTFVAFLPGHYRPQLKQGMRLRIEIAGYRYAYQWVTVESVAEEVTGPAEARRFLGADAADSVGLTGPVVLVRGTLPAGTFSVGQQTLSYHDGMLANAEAPVREEPIVLTLLPGLRAVLGGGRD